MGIYFHFNSHFLTVGIHKVEMVVNFYTRKIYRSTLFDDCVHEHHLGFSPRATKRIALLSFQPKKVGWNNYFEKYLDKAHRCHIIMWKRLVNRAFNHSKNCLAWIFIPLVRIALDKQKSSFGCLSKLCKSINRKLYE